MHIKTTNQWKPGKTYLPLHFTTLQYSALQYSALQYTTVQCALYTTQFTNYAKKAAVCKQFAFCCAATHFVWNCLDSLTFHSPGTAGWYTVYCTPYTMYCILYTVKCKKKICLWYTLHCKMCTIYGAVYIVLE